MTLSGLRQVAQQVEDLDRAVTFYREVVGLDFLARSDPPGIAFFDLGGIRLLLERGAPSSLLYRHVVAARRDSVLVGFALLFVNTDEGDADLNDLAVSSNQQRAGVGYAVSADAVDWMRELACREITGLAVHPGAQRIFDRLGFAPHLSPGSVLHLR